MTVTITRTTAVLLLTAVALAVTGTATAGKVRQMFTGANIVNGSLTGLDVKKASLGGGGQILYPAGNWVGSEVALSSSLPNGSGWIVRAIEAGPVAGPGTWQLEGHVVCAAVAA